MRSCPGIRPKRGFLGGKSIARPHGLLRPGRLALTVGIWAVLASSAGLSHAQSTGSRAPGDLIPRTVGIIPFENISGQPDDDWIGIGIAETVTADVEQLDGLSVLRADAPRDVPNVSWIVSGSFQRLGDQLRITARVVDMATGTAREAVTVDGRIDDIFTLQDEIVVRLAGSLAGLADRQTPSSAPRLTDAGAQTRLGVAEGVAEPDVGVGSSGNATTPASVATGGITFGDRPPPAAAAAAGDAGALAGRVTVRPVRAETPPTVDGVLDDAVWENAARVTEFVQREPLDGAPATEARMSFSRTTTRTSTSPSMRSTRTRR